MEETRFRCPLSVHRSPTTASSGRRNQIYNAMPRNDIGPYFTLPTPKNQVIFSSTKDIWVFFRFFHFFTTFLSIYACIKTNYQQFRTAIDLCRFKLELVTSFQCLRKSLFDIFVNILSTGVTYIFFTVRNLKDITFPITFFPSKFLIYQIFQETIKSTKLFTISTFSKP